MAILLNLQELLLSLADNVHITSTEIGLYRNSTNRTGWLNLAQKAFVRDTECLSGNKDTSLVAVTSQQEYDLWTITNYLSVGKKGSVLFDGTRIPFKTMEQMYSEFGESWWNADAGKPQCWYMRGKRYLGLHPKPSITYVGDVITVFYNKRPADMTLTTDTPFDGNTYLEEYTEAPLLWASWKLLTKGKQTEEALMYAGLYEKMKNACKKDLRTDEPDRNYLRPFTYNRSR